MEAQVQRQMTVKPAGQRRQFRLLQMPRQIAPQPRQMGKIAPLALPGQTHALHMVDINGDGLKDLVTGRRWWAHGDHGDVSPMDPPCLYWFEAKKDKAGMISFTPHLIDDDSGVGTQFAVSDINGDGLLDIVISNKKGVFIFEQVRTD